jgi:hypothetical protein
MYGPTNERAILIPALSRIAANSEYMTYNSMSGVAPMLLTKRITPSEGVEPPAKSRSASTGSSMSSATARADCMGIRCRPGSP